MPQKHQVLAALSAGAISAAALVLLPLEPASAVGGAVRINEIESSGGEPGDWIELFNAGSEPVDLTGYVVRDDRDDHAYPLPEGTTIAAGAYLVLDEYAANTGLGHFDFGLGAEDRVRLFGASGELVDSYAWTRHAATTYGVNADGAWAETSTATRGAENLFPPAGSDAAELRLNEVDSQPADWVEVVNTGAAPVDLAGFELRDNSDDHRWSFPSGASLAPGEFLVVDEASEGVVNGAPGLFREAIGIGSADRIRLFSPDGVLLDDTLPWEGHAAIDGDAAKATLARCPDGQGDFVLAHPTPGAANVCADGSGEPGGGRPPLDTADWPGSAETRVLDATPMFLEDSSGLDAEQTEEGVVLWAVDNGEGRFWKLRAEAGGAVSFAEGWESGKRARFQKDAEHPDAPGPDAEGITVAGDGTLYLASERDNGAKGVNFNTVLEIDPEAPGPDVVASREWDLTGLLPPVSANLGIEAVEWVADAELAGRLIDEGTGAPYVPGDYPLHGAGLFFVAVEDGGQVFAFALNSDGTAQRVGQLDPGLPAVMALDYDAVLGGLWAVCDDGCDGAAALIRLNGAAEPAISHYARPAGLPNTNNEGFATAPAALASDGSRPAWWFTDGVRPAALRLGGLASETPELPGEHPGASDGGADGAGDAEGGTGSAGTGGAGAAAAGGAADAAGAATAAPRATTALARTGRDGEEHLLLGVAIAALLGTAALLVTRRRRAG